MSTNEVTSAVRGSSGLHNIMIVSQDPVFKRTPLSSDCVHLTVTQTKDDLEPPNDIMSSYGIATARWEGRCQIWVAYRQLPKTAR